MKHLRIHIKRLVREFRLFLTSALTTQSEEGSGLGIFLRSLLRKRHFSVRQVIGVNLAGLAFFAGVVVPQVSDAVTTLELTLAPSKTVVVVDAGPSVFQWPLRVFGLSQQFSVYHPGVDLTDPVGTPIYPIGDGVVTWIKYLPYGYGYHALVTHPDGTQSLYAHMGRIMVHEKQEVSKSTKLGEVGLTGRTSGGHLHLEIYEEGTPANPLEVLPQIKEN